MEIVAAVCLFCVKLNITMVFLSWLLSYHVLILQHRSKSYAEYNNGRHLSDDTPNLIYVCNSCSFVCNSYVEC